MTLRTFTVFFWALLIATAAIAGEEHRMNVGSAVDGDGEAHQVIEVESLPIEHDATN